MSLKTSASTILRRRLNPHQLEAIAFELAALQYGDEPFELRARLRTEELWQLACALRLIIKTDSLHLQEKHLEKLNGILEEILTFYRDRDAAAIVQALLAEV